MFRKDAAQVKRAAANLTSELRKGGRIFEVAGEDLLDALNLLESQSLMPLAEKLLSWFDQRKSCDLQDLGPKPKRSALSVDWSFQHFLSAAADARVERLLPGCLKSRFPIQETFGFAIEDRFMAAHRFAEPFARHFQCEKTMSLPGV